MGAREGARAGAGAWRVATAHSAERPRAWRLTECRARARPRPDPARAPTRRLMGPVVQVLRRQASSYAKYVSSELE